MSYSTPHHLQYMHECDLERLRDILWRLNIEATPLDGGWYRLTMWLPDPESDRERYRQETIERATQGGDAS